MAWGGLWGWRVAWRRPPLYPIRTNPVLRNNAYTGSRSGASTGASCRNGVEGIESGHLKKRKICTSSMTMAKVGRRNGTF
eukprot:5630394-Prorocentrum_lima.AAC.1